MIKLAKSKNTLIYFCQLHFYSQKKFYLRKKTDILSFEKNSIE